MTDIEVGQRVMALDGVNAPGFYAELAVVPARQVTALPDGLELTEAAALPVAWLSAWYCLRHLAKVTKDDTVVVKAAASGVGSAAVQIAAGTGARVVALAGSPDKTAWAAGFGAHDTLDTSAHPGDAEVEEVLRLTGGRGADVVLDTVGGPAFGRSLREVGHGGRVVALANVALEPSTIDTRDFYPKNAAVLGFQLTNLQIHGYDPAKTCASWPGGSRRVRTTSRSRRWSRWTRRARPTNVWNGATTGARSCWPFRRNELRMSRPTSDL